MRMLFGLLLVSVAVPVSAEQHYRVSFENVLTGPAVGTGNIRAVQIEVDFAIPGPVDVGFSLRKEDEGSSDGWGFGIHATRNWVERGGFRFVTQCGVRFFAPGWQYSRFRFDRQGGVLQWQEWDRISSNFQLFGATGTAGAWAPNVGVFVERDIWKVRIRGGIRATFHPFRTDVLRRSPAGELEVERTDRFIRAIFAPAIAIGF